MIKHIDLFSGIGGFALAADTVFGPSDHVFCDNDQFCQAVLKKHWPNSYIYGDIRTFTNTHWDGLQEPWAKQPAGGHGQLFQAIAHAGSGKPNGLPNGARGAVPPLGHGSWGLAVDEKAHLLTGGFPCQPFSAAGQRRGTDDNRFLWPEMLRVIQQFQPSWVIAENVRGILTLKQGLVFEQVCTDLENAGYQVQPFIIPAVALDAPTAVTGFGLLPTVRDPSQPGSWRADLKDIMTTLPTPAARDWKAPNGQTHLGKDRGHHDQLANIMTILPTPRAGGQGDSARLENRTGNRASGIDTTTAVGMKTGLVLQPAFVEWMMGFPPGWTDLNLPKQATAPSG